MAMTHEQYLALPEPQREAFRALWERSGISWTEMLAMSQAPAGIFPYVSVLNFHGMFVGIEPDGHTHT